MNRMVLSTALLSLGIAAGCAYDPATFPSQEELYDAKAAPEEDYPGLLVRTKRETLITAQVDEGFIVGQTVNLGRYKDPSDPSIRGVAFEQRVDLHVHGGGVSGVVGTLPVSVSGAREGGALRVRGSLRGWPIDYRLDDRKLSGVLGRCSYDLTRSGPRYKGQITCTGESPRDITVQLPPELARWGDAELGATLGILLGGC